MSHEKTPESIHEDSSHGMRKSSIGEDFLAEPGFEAPTEEELLTLRRVSDKIPVKAFTIAFVELVERLSYYGCVQVYSNYIQFDRPGTATGKALDPNASDAQPGFLGYQQRVANGITTLNQFWVYLIPLFGAYVADTYWGRFKTIWVSVLIAIVGHIILICSAIPSLIDNSGRGGAMAVFIIGMLIMGIGTGGFKPNISPLIAEQIPHERIFVKTLKSGERVIVDPAVTISRVYNWFYLFINIGALVGQISMAYAERYVGFWLSFLLPTIAFVVTLPVLFFCRNMYKRSPPTGSVLGPAFKLLMYGLKKNISANPVKSYKRMTDGGFWDRIKPSVFAPGTRPKWMTFDDAWVSEVARGFAACKVFVWYPLWWLTYNQINNNLTAQAAQMELHGVPNDVISNLDPFALIILIPVCDVLIYPFLRKIGINFSPIKRMFAGFMVGAMAMIWACVLQAYIYKKSPCGDFASDCDAGKATINVWAQTGSYILIALSEIFASITSLEYAFSKAPKNMRSMVMAVALFTSALAAALGEAFTSVSQDPLLVWNYGSMAVISFVAGILFIFMFWSLDKQEDALNALPTGHVRREQLDEEGGLPMPVDKALAPEKF
ncbi:peptide transporter PTR2-A [Microthyrium microscopicum]|uniref:Peptide transporter PTR2-A n=1 Tax=Microthyrium microscopicum TaxID=703497 RepID=A0A6A6UKR5_9PEZI|nr:peptide transporter PTR2-A [Microthyrium microscopicum]